ncbi:efflux RND transporter permease subunit [Leptospira santarosai]|uniref:efflux RND transporter permease subunit n=1 Tax=Leptospira santarosai TaxID=28183 RepID=UPI0002978890|nr:CusA/CzcA family heavy metal efflux RND transporter [Leptospira santarosai]EKR92002.1 heavy metal efflux pump, CzcA family [Leptospira santarosai str. CBC379]EMJ50460.1 heavy metal efflux pump, CzcA family [Leptospira santarosai str. HAI1349]EMP80793.1 heavy metal efflux pump, CzcA family [Leptospira santarosai str. CBC1531]
MKILNLIIESSLRYKYFTLAAAILSLAVGIWSWIDIRKEAYSDIADTQVRLVAKFPGKATLEVEERVTMPIERVLHSTPNLIVRRSRTINGLVVFQFVFEEGTDDYFARMRLMEKVRDAVIPEEVTPTLAPMSSPVGEVYRYVVESATGTHTPMELRTIQDWIVIPKLLQVSGIADVVTFGGLPKQFHVVTSPEKLIRYSVTVSDVIEAIKSNNLNTGGNFLLQGEQSLPIRSLGAIRTPEDIEDIVVKTVNGVPVYVKDIGSVEISHPIPSGVLGYTVQNEQEGLIDVDSAVQGLVAMRRWVEPNAFGDRVRAKVKEINDRYMPEGTRLRNTYDRGDLVKYTLRTVGTTLLEGIAVVSLVVIFFIGSLRASIVVVATIPFALLFSFTMMNSSGISASLLSLGAVDFGIVVDSAVVMVENIMRRYKNATPAEKQKGIIRFTYDCATEVGTEILFAILIIILAYLPIFSFERIEGRLFKPMAFTLSFAIFGALLFTMTVVPVLMSFFYRKYFESKNPGPIEWHNPVYEWVERSYEKIVHYLVNRSKKVVAIAFTGVTGLLVVGMMSLGTEFLPSLDEGGFTLRLYFPVGISLPEAKKFIPKIRGIIYKNEQVNMILSQYGRNDDGTDPLPPNRLEIYVGLKDYKNWNEKITKEQLLIRMRNDLEEGLPGVKVSFSQPIMDNLSEAIMGTIADLAVFVSGQDLTEMRHIAQQILDIVSKMKGASEYGIEQEGPAPQLVIRLKRAVAARYGINISDIQNVIEAAVGMEPISYLYEGPMDTPPKERALFGIAVRFAKDYRQSAREIANIPIISPKGERIPLSELADITQEDSPTMIFRQDGKRTITVRLNVRGRDQGGFVSELQERVKKEVKIPEGFEVRYGGQYENLARVGKQLAIVIPVTIGIIFGLLFMLYRDLKSVIVALSCIPLSLLGGIYALLARGYYFNVSAGVGFISLFGIATMAGILFVSKANHLRHDDIMMSVREASILSAVSQLRPRLMTMLLALLGLIPATMASGVGSDVQRPLATVMVGGLASALLLVLTVMPSLYILIMGSKEDVKGKNVSSNVLSGDYASVSSEPEIYSTIDYEEPENRAHSKKNEKKGKSTKKKTKKNTD